MQHFSRLFSVQVAQLNGLGRWEPQRFYSPDHRGILTVRKQSLRPILWSGHWKGINFGRKKPGFIFEIWIELRPWAPFRFIFKIFFLSRSRIRSVVLSLQTSFKSDASTLPMSYLVHSDLLPSFTSDKVSTCYIAWKEIQIIYGMQRIVYYNN